jgi:signal transduction histidine kinase
VKQVSLTGRIIAGVVVCQLLLTGAITLASLYLARRALLDAFDSELTGHAVSTLACVRYTDSEPTDVLFDRALLPLSTRKHPDRFEIRKSNGDVLARSDQGVPAAALEQGKQYVDFKAAGVTYRAVALREAPVLDDEETVTVPLRVTVVYASSLGAVQEHLEQLAASVAGSSLLLLIATSFVASWAVRRGLYPLNELAAQASMISVRNWSFHPPESASTTRELLPLTNALDAVLARLKDAFRQQRDFTSDAAHELKTSVAIVKSTLQSLLHRPRQEADYRAGLERMLEDCGRLEDLLQRMLRLARIEQASENGMRHVGFTELTSTCEAAISRIEVLAQSRGVGVELVDSVSVHLRADPEDLELIWVNLLENAVNYSPAGSTIGVRVSRNGGDRAKVFIEDCGPGIPPEELPYIFERFRRADRSRARSTGGFGLGLAICKAMVLAYGGSIEAANRLQQGTEVRVELPVELC